MEVDRIIARNGEMGKWDEEVRPERPVKEGKRKEKLMTRYLMGSDAKRKRKSRSGICRTFALGERTLSWGNGMVGREPKTPPSKTKTQSRTPLIRPNRERVPVLIRVPIPFCFMRNFRIARILQIALPLQLRRTGFVIPSSATFCTALLVDT